MVLKGEIGTMNKSGKMIKRLSVTFLAVLCMVFSVKYGALQVSAEERMTTTCPNHPEHTVECGYVESVEGASCTHSCEQCSGVQVENIEEVTDTPEGGNTEEVTDTPEGGNTEEVTDTPEGGNTEEVTDTPEGGNTEEVTENPEAGNTEEVTESPADESVPVQLQTAETETHTHDNMTFRPWPSDNTISTSENYYLTQDVTLSSNLEISNRQVYICLNGHTLNLGQHCIYLSSGTTLTIYDHEGKGVITGGGGRGDGKGGAFYVENSTLTIYGGSIEKNNADWGGAIFIAAPNSDNSTVNMYGGTIQNNTATFGGGGIEVEDNNSVLNMYGGSIVGNTVKAPNDNKHKGGGVHFNRGTMTVQGTVIISGNKVGDEESNVYLRNNDAKVTIMVNELSADSQIGVSAQGIEEKTSGEIAITNTGISSEKMKCFFMDGIHNGNQYALINNDQQLMIKKHTHKWNYRWGESKNTVYAYCTETNPQCQYYGEENKSLPLTITAQSSFTFNGSVYDGAKLDETQLGAFNAATGNNLSDTDIVYYTDENLNKKTSTENGADTEGKAPKNAGTYYAAISVNGENGEGVTAKVAFTINKASVTVTAPTTVTGITYNGNAQSLINEGTADGGEMQYQIAENADALQNNKWTDIIPKVAEAGKYRIYYRVIADKNHISVDYSESYPYVEAEIAKAASNYTGPEAANSLTYNGNSQQLMATAGVTACGTIMYSLGNEVWETDISKIAGTNAGIYTVYWKLVGDSNHEDVTGQPFQVTIQKAKPYIGTSGSYIIISGEALNSNVRFDGYTMTGVDGKVLPGTFTWKDGTIVPSVGETQIAIFKPADTTNYEEAEVPVTVQIYYLPTGKITVEDRTWDKLLEAISFGIYHTKQQEITIEGAVNEKGGYEIDKIYYYIDTTGSTNVLKAGDLEGKWLEYDGNRKPVIVAQSNNVIYAKITDNGGNAIILCSNGIVMDGMAPVINGIENDGKYCESVTVTVTDKNLDKVTLDGTEVTLTDGEFTISADNNTHTIKATDAAGNATEYTVTVYKEHDFTNSKGTEISRDGNVITEEFLCAHGCGEKFTRKRTTEGDVISEEYPKDGGSGSNESLATGITTEKPGTPEAKISGLDIAVVKEIKGIKGKLNASEISQVENGETLLVYLEINKVEEKDVTAEDQAKTEEQAAEKKLQQGIYLDMSMWKKIGSADAERLGSTQISKKVKITLTLPEELKAPAGKERTYYVIRVHDGVAEVLDTQLDGSDISFMTDRFSTYSIWYEEKDTQTPSGGNDNPSGQPGDSGKPNTPGQPGDSGKPNTPGTSGDSDRPNTPGSTEGSEKQDTSNSGKTDSSGNPDVSNSQNSNNTGNITAPKTGDESNMVLWSMLLLVSVVALAEVTAKRKRG